MNEKIFFVLLLSFVIIFWMFLSDSILIWSCIIFSTAAAAFGCFSIFIFNHYHHRLFLHHLFKDLCMILVEFKKWRLLIKHTHMRWTWWLIRMFSAKKLTLNQNGKNLFQIETFLHIGLNWNLQRNLLLLL